MNHAHKSAATGFTSNRIALALALWLGLFAAGAGAQPGYLSTSRDTVVRSGYGLCWHTSQWSSKKAITQCDAVQTATAAVTPAPRKAASAPRAAAPTPRPVPQPAPLAAAVSKPAAPVIERLTLETDVLFGFDSAELRPSGRSKLEELAVKLHGARIEQIDAIGYADRIASEPYNQRLSEERAQAVKAYLETLGIRQERVHTEGRGESEPLTGDACRHMGPEHRDNAKLVAYLQPDRRVEIEVRGARDRRGPNRVREAEFAAFLRGGADP